MQDCILVSESITVLQVARMSLQTLNDIFFSIASRNQAHFLLRQNEAGWEPISSKEFATKVAGVVTGLRSWGISRRDRVAILSENRHEWVVADFACMLLGAVVVPIYTTLTAEQTSELLCDSGARGIFISSDKHLQKVLSIRPATGTENIAVMDDMTDPHAARMSDFMKMPADPQMEAMGRSVKPDDLATIIYTSGTTGTPKGVMLTHGNMAANINYFCRDFEFHEGLTSISFLPLSHVTARCVDMGLLSRGVTLAHLPKIDQLPETLLQLRPHILLSVPRVYEKVHTQVEIKAIKFPEKRIYQWALRTGRKHRNEILAGTTPTSRRWKMADRLVYSKVRAGLGGRVQTFVSGGAPLGLSLAEWYADVGLRICEGYGLKIGRASYRERVFGYV